MRHQFFNEIDIDINRAILKESRNSSF